MSCIEIQYATSSGGRPAEGRLVHWARAAIDALPRASGTRELTVRVVDADEARALNARYRGRDYATNVLSFAPSSDGWPDDLRAPLGDLVVCAPVVEQEADGAGRDRDAHWCHLIVHGVLHLGGYDHEVDSDAASMQALERRIVTGLGFGDPYA